MQNQELLRHAARCRDLAESCHDQAVAAKLRELASYYRDLASVKVSGQSLGRTMFGGAGEFRSGGVSQQ
jgi:hypothetical protein